jgi:hypothetical protein
VTFTLRNALAIVTLSALVCALTIWVPPVGLFVASFLPLYCLLILRKSKAATRKTQAIWWLGILLAIAPIYVGSVGPAFYMYVRSLFNPPPFPMNLLLTNLETIYAPLDLILLREQRGIGLNWYMSEWMALQDEMYR